MNVLIWHVHGSWTTAFVHGRHDYVIPLVPDRGEDGRGRAQTWHWPPNAREITPHSLADEAIDAVIVQRPRDEALANEWLGGRRVGRDIPAIWLEHNAPQGLINDMRHPAHDRDDVLLVHVTHTNQLFWDSGRTRTRVIEHGIIDPGYRYRGSFERVAAVVNEPLRRGRVVGCDVLCELSTRVPVDLYGMGVAPLTAALSPDHDIDAFEDLPQEKLFRELAERRVYVHPFRWTSLGLSLIEAMHLGLPVVALSTTEVPEVVPADAGIVTNDIATFHDAAARLLRDPERAAHMGRCARAAARRRFGLERFLSDWDDVIEEVTS